MDLADLIAPPGNPPVGRTSIYNPRLTQNTESFDKKWAEFEKYRKVFSNDVYKGIRDYDASLVSQSRNPMTRLETVSALIAANDLQQVTKKPDEGDGWSWNPLDILGNAGTLVGGAAHDVADLAKGLFKLPQALYDQYKAYSTNVADFVDWGAEKLFGMDPNKSNPVKAAALAIGGQFGAASQELGLTNFKNDPKVRELLAAQEASKQKLLNSDNFWDYPGNLANLLANTPGAALTPGVATLSRALPGGEAAGEIAKHPLMTALDVLPYKLKLAEMSTIGRVGAAEAADAVGGSMNLTKSAARKAANQAFKDLTAADIDAGTFRQFGQKVRERLPVRADTFEAAQRKAFEARVAQFENEAQILPEGPWGMRPVPTRVTEEGQLMGAGPTTGATNKAILKETKVGQGFTDLWGKVARAFSADVSDLDQQGSTAMWGDDTVQANLPPEMLREPVYQNVRRTREFLYDTATKIGMTPEDFAIRKQAINEAVITGKPELLKALTQEEYNFALESRALADWMARENPNVHFNPNNGEVFTAPQYASYVRRGQVMEQRIGRLNTYLLGEGSAVDKWFEKLTDPKRHFDAQALTRWGEFMNDIEVFKRSTDPDRVQRLLDSANKKFSRVHVTPGARNVGNRMGATLMQETSWRNFMTDLKKAADTEKRFQNYRPLPARYHGMVGRETQAALRERAMVLAPDKVDEVIKNFERQHYAEAYIPDPEWDAALRRGDITLEEMRVLREKAVEELTRQFAGQWEDIREATGEDPVFLHRVSPKMLQASRRPRISGVVQKETQTQARQILAREPYYNDLTIGLHHQAMEMLRTKMQQDFADKIAVEQSVDLATAMGLMRGRAEVMVRRLKEGDEFYDDVEGLTKNLVSKNFMELNPKSMFGVERASGWDATGGRLVPATLGRTMERMTKGNKGPIAAALDPVTSLYRIAVTAFRPSTQMNNILTNLVQTMIEEPGALNPRNLRMAVKAARAGVDVSDLIQNRLAKIGTPQEMIDEVMRSPAHSAWTSEFQQILRENSDMLHSDGRAIMGLRFLGGRTMRRLVDELDKFGDWQDKMAGNLPPGVELSQNVAKRAGRGFFKMNGYIDDVNRTLLYSHRLEKNLKRGMAPAAAADDATKLARKTAMNWRAMTPLEREILRPLIPFYAWMQHIVRYAKQYPVDHPIRTELLNNTVRIEMEDWYNKPPSLQSLLFPSLDKGDRWATGFNFDSVNPFQTPASVAALTGFLTGDRDMAGEAAGNLNPILGVMLQTMGIDPRSGSAELYPDLTVNPHTGQLTVAATNPIENLILNTVPQVGGVQAILGMRHQEGMDNPSAKQRAILTSFGVPTFYKRRYDVSKAYATNEASMQKQQKAALNRALKTGDYAPALRWEGLRTLPQESLGGANLEQFTEMQRLGLIPEQQVQTPEQRLAFATKLAADTRQKEQLESLAG